MNACVVAVLRGRRDEFCDHTLSNVAHLVLIGSYDTCRQMRDDDLHRGELERLPG